MTDHEAISDFSQKLGVVPKMLNSWRDNHLNVKSVPISHGELLVLVDTRFNSFAIYHDDYSHKGCVPNYQPRFFSGDNL